MDESKNSTFSLSFFWIWPIALYIAWYVAVYIDEQILQTYWFSQNLSLGRSGQKIFKIIFWPLIKLSELMGL